MRYQVELDELLAFVDRLQAFESHARSIATRVDEQVAALHSSWSRNAAEAHLTRHQEWMAGADQMREALAELRAAAHNAHRNYIDAAQRNVEMLS